MLFYQKKVNSLNLELLCFLGVSFFPVQVIFILPPVKAEIIITQNSQAEINTLFQQGGQQFARGELKSAKDTYQQVLSLQRKQGDKPGEAATLIEIGEIKNELFQEEESLPYYQQALTIYQQLGDQSGEAKALTNIGKTYINLSNYFQASKFLEKSRALEENPLTFYQLGRLSLQLAQYPQALTYWQKFLEISSQVEEQSPEKQLRQQLREGTTLVLMAITDYFQTNQQESADKIYQVALDKFKPIWAEYQKLNHKFGQGKTLYLMGNAYSISGQYAEALRSYQQALTIFQELNLPLWEAQIFLSIGNTYLFQGDFAAKLTFIEKALTIYQEMGELAKVAATLSEVGDTYHSLLNEYSTAVPYYQQALAIYQKLDDSSTGDLSTSQLRIAQTLSKLALNYVNLAQYSSALENYQQALAIYQELNQTNIERKTVASILQGIGNIYVKLGQYAQAQDYLQQALTMAEELDDLWTQSQIISNLVNISVNLGQFERVQQYLAQDSAIRQQITNNLASSDEPVISQENQDEALLSLAQKTGNRTLEAIILSELAEKFQNSGDYPQAISYYQQALGIYQEIGQQSVVASNLGRIALLHYDLQQYGQALDYFQQALSIYEEIGEDSEVASMLTIRGQILVETAQYPQAETELLAAIEIWESVREGLTDEEKVSLLDVRSSSYRYLQQALIAQNKKEEALLIAERGRARAFIDLLLSRVKSLSTQAIKSPPPITLKQIQQIAQQQRATLVEYSLITEQQALYIWVIQPNGEVAFRSVDLSKLDTSLDNLVTISRESIGARGIRSLVESFAPRANQDEHLEKLYQILIQPIANLLPNEPDAPLIFLPQKSLFLVPFPALKDTEGNYLIENHTILSAPSIQVLQLTRGQKSRGPSQEILIVGNPTMPEIGEPPEQLPPLPGAEQEALAIGQILNTQPLTGDKATKEAILPLLTQAELIHFATHGLLDDFGTDIPGALALAPSEQDDGLLTAREILDLKLKAQLVVLSACDTGRGEITGDGVIGLSRSLITAGVPSIVVSLWSVPDAPTAQLMTEFYRQMQQNHNKARALREAMLTTMKQHPNPVDWAAFTLIGEAK